MTRKENSKRTNETLDIEKLLSDFQKAEESSSHRNGTFKIEKPIDEALDTILKADRKKTRRQKLRTDH
jgi:hypothetical protein